MATTALNLLWELGKWENHKVTPTIERCALAIFESPCYATVMAVAMGGGSYTLKRVAWQVIRKVACVSLDRKRDVFTSPKTTDLLLSGLLSPDSTIPTDTTITISKLCHNADVAYAILEGVPAIVGALVKTFTVGGISDKFLCELGRK